MSKLKTEYLALKKKAAEIANEVKSKSLALLKEEAKEIFSTYPEVESFGWTQGAPSFNDGDPCYFSAYTEEPQINGKYYGSDETVPEKAMNAICDLLELFDNNDYEEMFGDGQKITVTKNGIEKEHYYCE